jgi:hypothetical protein
MAVPANRPNDAFTVSPTLDCNTIVALTAAQYPCGNRNRSARYRQTTAATPVLTACLRSPVLKRVKIREARLTMVIRSFRTRLSEPSSRTADVPRGPMPAMEIYHGVSEDVTFPGNFDTLLKIASLFPCTVVRSTHD